MKKRVYKILSGILCVALLLSTLPFTSFAITANGTCGENVSWSFDESTGVLSIEGTGDMQDYNHLYGRYCPWYKNYGKLIKGVIIGDGVTSIGNYSFSWCGALTDVSIADSVTKIGNRAFEHCRELQQIELPENVTVIGEYAFSSCTAMESIELGTNVADIGSSAFSYCEKLTKIDIPNGITAIETNTFNECKSLKEIVLPDSIISIGSSAFSGCDSLTNIEIPESVECIGTYAFSDCATLESVVISGKGLKEVGGNVFGECVTLKSLSMPDSFKGEDMFTTYSIPAVSSVYIADGRINMNWNGGKITKLSIDAAASDVNAVIAVSKVFGFVEEIELHPDNQSFKLIDGVLYDSDVKTILVYPTGTEKTKYVMPDSVEDDLLKPYVDTYPCSLPAAQSLKSITFGKNFWVKEIEACLTEEFVENYSASASVAEKRYLLENCFYKLNDQIYNWFSRCNIEEVSVSPEHKYLSVKNGMLMINYDGFNIILCQMQDNIDSYTFAENTIAARNYPFYKAYVSKLSLSDEYTQIAYETSLYRYKIYSERNNITYTAEEMHRLALADIVLPFTSGMNVEEFSVSATNKYLSAIDGVLFDKTGKILLAYPLASERNVYEIPDVEYFNAYAFSWLGEGGMIKNKNLTIHLPESAFNGTMKSFNCSSFNMDASPLASYPPLICCANAAGKICISNADYFQCKNFGYGCATIEEFNELTKEINAATNIDELLEDFKNEALKELMREDLEIMQVEIACVEVCEGHELSFTEKAEAFFKGIIEKIISFFNRIFSIFILA